MRKQTPCSSGAARCKGETKIGVILWFDHGASILKQGQRTSEAGIGVELMGVPTKSDMFSPLTVAGRWLRPDDGLALVILKEMADDHDIRLGDTIILDLGELGDDEWQVIGCYQSILTGGVGDTDPVYANLGAVYRATKKHNIGSDLYVRTRLHQADYAETMAAQLKAMFNARNLDTDFSDTVYE